MEKIYIMTWNTELYVESTSSVSNEKYKAVKEVVERHLEQKNAVCFLQEIPYKSSKPCKSSKPWKEHTIFSTLKEDFPEEQYDIIFHLTSKNQIMMTIAIARKGIISPVEDGNFSTNRTVTVRYKNTDLFITGIHADNGKDNKTYLTRLDQCGSAVILGDFNAGDYQESENRDVFNSILKGHRCICSEITRWRSGRPTPIDHVFVANYLLSKCSRCVVHKEITCSDHYPITFEIDWE